MKTYIGTGYSEIFPKGWISKTREDGSLRDIGGTYWHTYELVNLLRYGYIVEAEVRMKENE